MIPVFIAALEPPLGPLITYSGVNATIYPLGPIAIDPTTIPLAINAGPATPPDPTAPLSATTPL